MLPECLVEADRRTRVRILTPRVRVARGRLVETFSRLRNPGRWWTTDPRDGVGFVTDRNVGPADGCARTGSGSARRSRPRHSVRAPPAFGRHEVDTDEVGAEGCSVGDAGASKPRRRPALGAACRRERCSCATRRDERPAHQRRRRGHRRRASRRTPRREEPLHQCTLPAEPAPLPHGLDALQLKRRGTKDVTSKLPYPGVTTTAARARHQRRVASRERRAVAGARPSRACRAQRASWRGVQDDRTTLGEGRDRIQSRLDPVERLEHIETVQHDLARRDLRTTSAFIVSAVATRTDSASATVIVPPPARRMLDWTMPTPDGCGVGERHKMRYGKVLRRRL